MKISSVGISNYRSIGEDPVTLNLRRKMNLIIGSNNSGKSNVLRALELLGLRKADWKKPLLEIDRHRRNSDTPIKFSFELEGTNADHPVIQKSRSK